MKSTFFVLIFLCSLEVVQAQTQQAQTQRGQTQQAQTQPAPAGQSQNNEVDLYSNAEKFADSAGLLIQKEYIPLGHILTCNIQVVHITDMVNGTRRNALRFINSQNQQAYLDEDEVGALEVSMSAIRDKVLATTPANYTEVKYKSRSGFEAGCVFQKGAWQSYLWLKRHDDTTMIVMKRSDFDVFLQILNNVKAKIDQ